MPDEDWASVDAVAAALKTTRNHLLSQWVGALLCAHGFRKNEDTLRKSDRIREAE